ncbi:replicative DNA helicase [Sphingomonas montanisoli]|uniref:DNA 5'-3' helicase n=1 Tax=Sphingomonas montanisoli TaxID=2606412 RepID=A0A5D9C9J3_9SPHN|nr:DnaB-like helicase C-terminal domain-containing protein [Sphingomonas montanisoli]TZG28588.1 hypothetical protein FYJ91_00050 [Sphingomonas montanisoli]
MSVFAVREAGSADLILSNPAAEQKIIGQLLYDDSWAEVIGDKVDDRDFADPLLGRIFAVAMREVAERRRVNLVLLAPLFKDDDEFHDAGGQRYLQDLTRDAMTDRLDDAYCSQVRLLATQRRLIASLRETIQSASVPGADLPAIVASADSALSAAIEARDDITFRDGSDCIDEVIDGFDRQIVGVTSGIVEGIDHLIGAIRPGWLGILAARPGMGKTATIVSYLRGAAAQGHHVLLASLEMTWETLALRLIADHCHSTGQPVSFDAIMNRRVQDHHRRQIRAMRDEIAALPMKVIDKRCHTLGQLRRAIRRHKRLLEVQGKKLDLVAVDYLQLLRPDHRGNSEFDDVSEVSRTLKQMAGEEDVAIIALSQLSRSVESREDKRPRLSDLRSSGQIEQDADFVIFLLSEEYYLSKEEPRSDDQHYDAWASKMERARDRLEFSCAKFRHGADGIHHGKFFRRFQAVR